MTFRTTYYFKRASIFESISFDISTSPAFFYRMIEFFIGDVSVSNTIFYCAPGIDTFLLFLLFLYSMTIFYWFAPPFYLFLSALLKSLILNVFKDWDLLPSTVIKEGSILAGEFFFGDFPGESIFLRIRFDTGYLGELFLIFFSSAIMSGFFRAFKS